ncbi:MAG: acetolactate synthase small subunit [Spirochaetota bacterium]|nr:acetolactate synthase small subunit [Spirochaetota bacterium]
MKHTILLKVRNHAGVMAHVVGLFARRAYNIDSIAVGTRENPKESVITIIVDDQGNEQIIRQIDKQLRKMVDVISIRDFPYNESVNRELALILLKFKEEELGEVMEIVNVFGANVEDMTEDTLLIDISAVSRKVRALIRTLSSRFEIVEMARTGEIALPYQTP